MADAKVNIERKNCSQPKPRVSGATNEAEQPTMVGRKLLPMKLTYRNNPKNPNPNGKKILSLVHVWRLPP